MKKSNDISEAWASETRIHWTGKHFRVDNDHLIPRMVVAIDNAMHELAKSRGDQFRLVKTCWGRNTLKCSPVATKLIECARTCDQSLVRQYLSRHKFSPYFEAFERYWPRFSWLRAPIVPDEIVEINRWVGELRAELKASSFREEVEKQRRTANKNAEGMRQFIGAMFRHRAKILVVRVDLGYKHDPDDRSATWVPPSDELVKKQLQRMFRYIRRNVPGKPRIVWKLEWGAKKGHHVHLMVLCRGDEVREGATWGRVIGEQWLKITKDAGSYWNCHSNEALFESLGRRGIGLITYADEQRRKNLMAVAMYMVKADVYARFVSPSIARTFGKSKWPDNNEKRGRPRKYVDPIEDTEMVA